MGIIEKDPNKVEVETEISEYKENFNSEITWEDEIDTELDNIFSEYNLIEVLVMKAKEPKRTYKE